MSVETEHILGIDVGGTRIKGGMVDLKTGKLIGEAVNLQTPESKTPQAIGESIQEIVNTFGQHGCRVGVGFPAVIKDGISLTASNVDKSFIGYPVATFFSKLTGCGIVVINDADAAGIAEMTYGCGKKYNEGTVILLTLGTGIGSAIFKDGYLLKNTELGHLRFRDSIAEHYASNSARKRHEMSWETYGTVLNEYLEYVHSLFYPDMIILGGGISKVMDEYKQYFSGHLQVRAADNLNNAGIIGAAVALDWYGQKRKGSD